MNLHILQLPKLVAERRSSAIFGMIIIAMLWVGIIVKYFEDAQDDLREAERTNQNFAMVFEENVLRSIGEIDKALLYLRRSIETRKDSTDFNTIVNTTDVLSEIIVQVAIIDANGIMRASNVGPQPAPPIDLSDREHYKVHVNSTEDQLFISKPVIGRVSGKWSVQFSRRFLNRDGTFGGVVVASLNPEHFTKFYDKIDFGSIASISLIGSDGVVRSSGGSAGGFALGQDLRGTKLFAQMRAGANTRRSRIRSAERRPLLDHAAQGPRSPAVGERQHQQERDLKSSWADLQVNALAVAALTLIMLIAMERILQTEAGAKQKAEQLQLTLENMSQGIMLVTKDLQIPIINGRCGELLDLPDEFIKHPPRFDQLVEFQTRNAGPGRQRRSSHCAKMAPRPALPAAGHGLRARHAERHRDGGAQRASPRRQLRADLHRHHQAVRGGSACGAARVRRPSDRPAEPALFRSALDEVAGGLTGERRMRNSPCCSSISTASRSSTTRSVTGSATCCCRRWPSG